MASDEGFTVEGERPFTATLETFDTVEVADGRLHYLVDLKLSELIWLPYREMRDFAFEVTNGTIVKARRVERKRQVFDGRARTVSGHWRLEVRPEDANTSVTVALKGLACGVRGGMCSARGGSVGNIPSIVVNADGSSPLTLSIADATGDEADKKIVFVISLSRKSPNAISLRYRSIPGGSATEGADYRRIDVRNLIIPHGVTTWNVGLVVIDDEHDDGGETVRVEISDAQLLDDRGRAVKALEITRAVATGTITNTDAMPRAWLARFGRTVAEDHVDAVRERLRADRSPGLSGRFAGQPLPGPAGGAEGPGPGPDDSPREGRIASSVSPAEDAVLAFRAPAVPELPEDERLAYRSLLADDGEGEDGEGTRTLASDDVLLGTSFLMTRESGTGLSTGHWGRAARSGFSGRDGETDLDGEVTSVMLGNDWKRKGTLFGLIVSGSRGTGTYDGASPGAIDARLTAVVPYAGREIGDGLSAWGAAGIGQGEMTLTPDGADPVTAGIGWSMAAAGAEGDLAPGERLGGADLGWHADALWTRTASDAATGLASSVGETVRLRLGLKAAWERTLVEGVTLRPRLEIGLRHDGGDAETGHGIEIGGGIGIGDPASGLSMTIEGRALALHEDGAFESWGLGASVSWDPRPETRRGWSATAGGSLGGSSSGGVDALLGPEAFPGLPEAGGEGGWSLEAAYGTGRGHGMVGSPYARAGGSDGPRLGWRVEPDADHAADARVDLWAGGRHGRRRPGRRGGAAVALVAGAAEALADAALDSERAGARRRRLARPLAMQIGHCFLDCPDVDVPRLLVGARRVRPAVTRLDRSPGTS